MDGYKEFQGKSLDEAIREACSYFDAPREKLEIDIVQDSKSGIFGIVGARKAKIRARRAQIGRLGQPAQPRDEAPAPPKVARGAEAATAAASADAAPAEAASVTAGESVEPKAQPVAAPTGGDADNQPARRDERPRREPEGGERRDRGERSGRRDDAPQRAVPHSDAEDMAGGDAEDRAEDSRAQDAGERSGRRRRRGGRGRRDRDGDARGAEAAAGDGTERGAGEAGESDGRTDGRADGRTDGRTDGRSGGRQPRAPRPQRAPRPARGPRDGGDGQTAQRDTSRGGRPDREGAQARAGRVSDMPPLSAADDADDHGDHGGEGLPEIPLEQLDRELVTQVAVEVMERLVTPIIGEAGFSVELAEGRVNVSVDCGENSGLLIGREGQTLTALQYLSSRIVSRRLGASVRVQLDSGDYRERQDDKLREIALHLADRVRATGKPQSTRPLSSYHRRVVHVTLQEEADVVTRSKGDGPLKRVIIMPRRKG